MIYIYIYITVAVPSVFFSLFILLLCLVGLFGVLILDAHENSYLFSDYIIWVCCFGSGVFVIYCCLNECPFGLINDDLQVMFS